MRLKNKTVLITGATGIAAATAELAVQAGARVFLTSIEPETGRVCQERLRAVGGDCEYMSADLRDPQAVAGVLEQCTRRFQRLDAVFNVAGISGRRFGDGPVHECTEEGWDATVATNVKTVFLVCRAALRIMLPQPPDPAGARGVILNTSSVVAFSPSSKYFATHAYAASKAAIIGLSKSMASYYAPYKIRVNVIAPAATRTPMSQRAQQDAEVMAFIQSKQPLLEDMVDARSIARTAVFLLSDEASAITGDVVTVDGGWCVTDGQCLR